jgi:hypothetical protein
MKLLRDHIEMSVSATQDALKDALLKVYTAPDPAAPARGRRRAKGS